MAIIRQSKERPMRHFHTYINVLLGNLQTEKENREEETGGEAGKLENNLTQIMNELEKEQQ
jgi:hypothetical protein